MGVQNDRRPVSDSTPLQRLKTVMDPCLSYEGWESCGDKQEWPFSMQQSLFFDPVPHSVQINFDGGCAPNPGQKYGSWMVRVDGVLAISRNRFSLGYGTNNEAEWEALEMALKETLGHLERRLVYALDCRVLVITDSTVVRTRLVNKNRMNNKRMFLRAGICLRMLHKFASYEVEWKGRENNVELFGH